MWFTTHELKQINEDKKSLTIRRFKKNGSMPVKVGNTAYLKTGSMMSKERYGEINMIKAEVKPLLSMTWEDAQKGGYRNPASYILDHLNKYNKNCNPYECMIFYTFETLWTNDEKIKALR